METCYGCLQTKKLKNNYCTKCVKEIFGGIIPNKLNFDKKEFYVQRKKFANRMSMSGVQDKISLRFEGNDLVPTGENGEYILKPIPIHSGVEQEHDLPANEHLSMLISKNIFKIKTAECAVIKFSDGELAYITKRFDYAANGQKFDQEDFASILGVSSEKDGDDYKYNAKNYVDLARAVKTHVPAAPVSIESLFKRVLLNYLIANGDAHLKNFSLYSLPDSNDYMLTPNYDIMNTKYHINEQYGFMAMDLMEEYTETYEIVGYYTYEDFKKYAKLIGLNEKRFDAIYKLINSTEETILKLVDQSFLSFEGKKYYKNIYSKRLKAVNYIINK